MSIRSSLLWMIVAAVIGESLAARPVAAAEPARPNIVFILCDDLGYGDVGCFGQRKFKTPNIDRIAARGMRLTSHYSGNAVCALSRCVLLTGKHPGHAFIRDNKETKPEGQYPLPAGTNTLPRRLQALGYACGAFGKWGLGGPESAGRPLQQGFDRFFGYNCQAVAHNYYPVSLWDDETRKPLRNPPFSAHQKLPADADPSKPETYARYRGTDFAPDLIADAACQFITDQRERPFFLYFPTTIPHLALQVPDDSLREFQGKFEETPYPGGRGYLPHPTPRAAYAAMITRLDRDVGRLLDLLTKHKLDERTIIVFTSDNGPLYNELGGTDTEFFQSAGPFRGRKGSLYEGGVHVPGIVAWPGTIAAGSTSDRVTGFEDWLPTLLDLAGAKDATPKDLDGLSFAPTLRGTAQPARDFLYREFPGYGGWQSVRSGNWKLVRRHLHSGAKPKPNALPPATELYDLANDPGEANNLARQHPEILTRLLALAATQHTPSDLFPIRTLDGATTKR